MRHPLVCFALASLFLGQTCHAQTYKKLPPVGREISASERDALAARVASLRSQVDLLSPQQPGDVADIQVLIRAVELAIEQSLFFKKPDPKLAVTLLDEAERRLARYGDGKRRLSLMGLAAQPIDEPQLLIGGFQSQIDDSIQPFGLVVPAGFDPVANQPEAGYRVDVWLHGRGDTKTELQFLAERMSKPGPYTPANTFVLHPFGRHCNAFKFAGEKDVYECMTHLAGLINVDTSRQSIRGFSMGGAGCWHLAVHDPGRWFAANPGAGFVDTIVYQGWQDQTPFPIDRTRQKLLRWYDVLPWVPNLQNTQVVAYSGEVDKQRQAAERVMSEAAKQGLQLEHIIGADMGHKIDPASAQTITTILDQWSAQSRPSPRRTIDLLTYTLRYNRVGWLQITGLREHWRPATVRAELSGPDSVKIQTDGVTRVRLDFSDSNAFDSGELKVTIDGERLLVTDQGKQPGLQTELILQDGWLEQIGEDRSLRKRPGLQGPIDDAFCDRFVFVLPSRPATHGVVQRWIDRELEYAQDRWARLMRGNVRVVSDVDLSEEEIENSHLICFGDFTSNQFLRRIAGNLPVSWTRDALVVGSQSFDPSTHAAVLCYPNPVNPERYVVINSGMTFREFSNVSNSRQIAMLPDWAVINVAQEDGKPAGGIFPGDIAADGFFDEQWQLAP